MDPAKIRDTVGFMVNVSYLGIMQQRHTTRPASWTKVCFGTFVVDVSLGRGAYTLQGDTRTLIQSGRGTSRCVSLETWQRDSYDFRTRCACVSTRTWRGFCTNFGVRVNDQMWPVSNGEVAERDKVDIPRFEGRVVRSCEVCPTREKQRGGCASVRGVLLLSMCVFFSTGEPQSPMSLGCVSFSGTEFLSNVGASRTSKYAHDDSCAEPLGHSVGHRCHSTTYHECKSPAKKCPERVENEFMYWKTKT